MLPARAKLMLLGAVAFVVSAVAFLAGIPDVNERGGPGSYVARHRAAVRFGCHGTMGAC